MVPVVEDMPLPTGGTVNQLNCYDVDAVSILGVAVVERGITVPRDTRLDS